MKIISSETPRTVHFEGGGGGGVQYLLTAFTGYVYSYMALDIGLMSTQVTRETETDTHTQRERVRERERGERERKSEREGGRESESEREGQRERWRD